MTGIELRATIRDREPLIVGDYLSITSPEALGQLRGWRDLAGGAFEARLAELEHLRGSPD